MSDSETSKKMHLRPDFGPEISHSSRIPILPENRQQDNKTTGNRTQRVVPGRVKEDGARDMAPNTVPKTVPQDSVCDGAQDMAPKRK